MYKFRFTRKGSQTYFVGKGKCVRETDKQRSWTVIRWFAFSCFKRPEVQHLLVMVVRNAVILREGMGPCKALKGLVCVAPKDPPHSSPGNFNMNVLSLLLSLLKSHLAFWSMPLERLLWPFLLLLVNHSFPLWTNFCRSYRAHTI